MALSGTVTTNTKTDGRYYKLEWTASQSVDNNTSTISWTLYAAGCPTATYWVAERTVYVNIDDTSVYSKTAYVERKNGVVASGSKTLNHNSDGTRSFSISIGAAVYYTTVNATGSGSFTLNTIARASDLSVSNGTLGDELTITANQKSPNFTHTVTWVSGSYSGTIATKSSYTSWPFTPSLDLANGAPYGTSVYCEIKLATYNGSTLIGSVTKTIWLAIPDTVIPSVSLTLSDATGYSSTYGGYVQGQSILHVVVNASGAYGSSISSYSTSANGSTYTNQTFNTSVLFNAGSLTVKTTVKDSRNRTNTATATITVLPYSAPNISYLTAVRCDSDGTENDRGSYARLSAGWSYSTSPSNLSYAADLRIKKTSDSSWESVGDITPSTNSEYSTIYPADEASSYDVMLYVADSFTSTSRRISLSTGYCLYHIPASGKGITFGGIAEDDGFQVKMDAHFHNGLTEDIKVLDSGNCNELLTSGNYYIGTSGANKPDDGRNGWLTVKSYGDANYCYQEYVTYQGQRYYRMRDNGTWQDWILRTDYWLWAGVYTATTTYVNVDMPSRVKEIKIFAGGPNGDYQVYGGKSYIIQTELDIVFENAVYNANGTQVATGLYMAYLDSQNKLRFGVSSGSCRLRVWYK